MWRVFWIGKTAWSKVLVYTQVNDSDDDDDGDGDGSGGGLIHAYCSSARLGGALPWACLSMQDSQLLLWWGGSSGSLNFLLESSFPLYWCRVRAWSQNPQKNSRFSQPPAHTVHSRLFWCIGRLHVEKKRLWVLGWLLTMSHCSLGVASITGTKL